MIQGGRETGTGLVSHPGLNGLYFTGSFATGHALHTSFGGHPEKILALEMGGNNPLVAHEISDINAAAYVTVLSAFITSGQRCTCARRLILKKGRAADEFIDHLIAATTRIHIGPYTDMPEPFMGPVISEGAASALMSAQEKLLAKGALPLLPMTRLPKPGAFLTPGIVDVTPVRNRPDVEIFGPFLQVIRVADFDEAIVEANHTAYGLAAGLLSDSADVYRRFLRGVRAGVINWNRQTTGASGKMPFGGVKGSGNHRPSGYYAVDYCSYPVASIEQDHVAMEHPLAPGIDL
jgi:succinylglutamic semialdehyde dehydrogenase